MIIDTSAIVAMVLREPEADELIRLVAQEQRIRLSAVTWFETTMVLSAPRIGYSSDDLEQLTHTLQLEQITFTAEHAAVALETWCRYGKGNHQARLNLGDCASYAAAKLTREPLLYVGNDFAQTDIESALRGR